MKNFKDILREFREKKEPPRGGGGENDDPHNRIMEFMEQTPFTHVTTGEHEIHFNSSLDAARIVADKRENHQHGLRYADHVGDDTMMEYFGASTGTHDDVLDAIEDNIRNHPNLPSDLKPHVANTMTKIENRARSRANSTNDMVKIANPQAHKYELGRVVYNANMVIDAIHPNLLDDAHHLGDIIKIVKEDPDRGYFLKKEEYKD